MAMAASLTDLSVDKVISIGVLHAQQFTSREVVSARLFRGQPVDQDDQQDRHQYGDHRPKPYSSAHPTVHPSICVVHHKAPLAALRTAHPWSFPIMSVSSRVISK